MPITPEFFSFLVENRLHDSKSWFASHRGDYNRLVLEPLRELVEEMAPVMLAIDPAIVTQPRVGKTISRIFRDTRFTKDKSAFREHLWISFNRGKAERHQPVPELYFDLSPDGYSYGCGWYCAGTELMDTLRRMVLSGDPDAKKAVRAVERQKLFVLGGDLYRRPRHPDAPKALFGWVNRKNLYLSREGSDPAFLYAPDLGTRVAKDLATLEPVYRFLWKVQDTARAEAVHPAAALGEF